MELLKDERYLRMIEIEKYNISEWNVNLAKEYKELFIKLVNSYEYKSDKKELLMGMNFLGKLNTLCSFKKHDNTFIKWFFIYINKCNVFIKRYQINLN